MKHENVSGVTAELRVGGIPLEEFDDDEDALEERTTTKYVEAVSGANFTVHVKLDRSTFPDANHDIDCVVCLDGKDVGGKIWSAMSRSEIVFEGCSEREYGQTYIRKFLFSELQTGDGAVAASLKKELVGSGTVTVKLIRCVKLPSKGSKDIKSSFKPVGDDKLSEKALKGRALSNRTSLGEKEKSAAGWCSVEYPWGKEPLALFTFKYRSRKDLQVEGIIERSPSPPPLEERDPDTMTREELQELLRRRNEEVQELSQIKKEGVKRERSTTIIADGDDDEVLITGEGSSKRRRTSDDSGIEIVELTDD